MQKNWEKLINDVQKTGYDDYLVEYDNDFWIRNQIEEILKEQSLERFDEFREFKEAIFKIDSKLKELFLPNQKRNHSDNWWESGILKNGSGNYSEDLKLIGIEI